MVKDISERIVYKTKAIGEDPLIYFKIGDVTYGVQPLLHYFRLPKHDNPLLPPPKWDSFWVFSHMDLKNLVKKINHDWRISPITEQELLEIMKTAVQRGVTMPLDESNNFFYIGLTLDSWLRLEHPTVNSKVVPVTSQRVQQTIKNQDKDG